MAGGSVAQALPEASALRPYHLDIIQKAERLTENLTKTYAEYRFNELGSLLYEFLWSEFCDKFLEAVKTDLRGDSETAGVTLAVFDQVMLRYFQALHPFMPHLTEELASRMGYLPEGEFLMNKPLAEAPLLDEISETASRAEVVYEVAGRLRNLKAEYHLAARKDVRFVVKNAVDWLADETDVLALLVGAEAVEIDSDFEVKKGTPTAITDAGEFVLPLDGLIDVEAEKKRLEKEISKVEKEVEKSLKKLQNPKFVDNAKPEVVATEKARHASWLEKLKQLRELYTGLESN